VKALRARMARRPVLVAGVAAMALLVAVVLVWFQSQKLFIDAEVNDVLPSPRTDAGAQPQPGGGAGAEEADVETLASGSFEPLAHDASGRSRLLQLADGSRYLRLERFSIENGPDLRIYLSAARDAGDSFVDDFVDLGALRGNIGDQNYRIPAGTDLARFASVVVWCRRFSVAFAVARLE
jgi:Electron transfer DM13